jgi:O-methyltransferase
MTPVELYLDLLKNVVTGNIYGAEPDHDSRDIRTFVKAFTQHYFANPAHAMVPRKRLDNVQTCVMDVLRRKVPGDLIEAGVWRGGTSIFMRGILEVMGVKDRRMWVADSFEGLPPVDPKLHPTEAAAVSSATIKDGYKNFAASLEEVKRNFQAYGLLDEQTRFLKGWFKDTLPSLTSERFAVVRLDGDLYESTTDALRALYPRLAPGGHIIIDDYGEDVWTECRRAVDEFRRDHEIREEIVVVDSKCVFWTRSA